ncbi:MAG: carbohydrate porin [Caulobacteraceae bacterium]
MTVRHRLLASLSIVACGWAYGGGVLAQALAPPPAEAAGGEDGAFAVHGQATFTDQYHPGFTSPYAGGNSLNPGQRSAETADVTLYAGVRPWRGAEFWVEPEIDQGFGLSNTLGVDAFTSGEAYKVGDSTPYFKLPRAFLRQTIELGGDSQKVDSDLSTFAGETTADRLVLTIGKFGVPDVFDTNKYAHDPRNDFLNWAVIDTGAFDYAANAWGFTYGAALEWYQGDWTLRGGLFDLSTTPNSTHLDNRFSQYQIDAEIERRYRLFGQDGAVRLTGFNSDGRMGRYADAVALAQATGQPANIALVRHFRARAGLSVNIEQAISDDLGVFARAGHSDPQYEGFEFTDMDNTAAAGLSLKGSAWKRKDDTFGLAVEVGEASHDAYAYFNAGGLGILAGDGMLPHPGPETVVETYYSLAAFKYGHVTLDYQFVDNPAFNRDRGPVSVLGLRLHVQV